jgi:murein DD-endopeptidase MepM/ murein hydrolase activator NlpD
VYSSDDDDEDSESSGFVLINRELEYLKQGTQDYLRKQKKLNLMNALGSNIWLDYTDQVEQEHQKAEAQKKRRTLTRKKRYASRRKPKSLGTLQESGAVAQSEVSDMALIWPIDRSSFWLSSFFGPRKHNGRWAFHRGIDMAAVRGTPVKAAASGVVVEVRYAQGYGKTIVIAHNAKYKTRYAHLNNILVKVGQKVENGDYVGRVGATGFVRSKRGGDASHLHFEVYVYGKQVNPMYFLG